MLRRVTILSVVWKYSLYTVKAKHKFEYGFYKHKLGSGNSVTFSGCLCSPNSLFRVFVGGTVDLVDIKKRM